MNEFNSQNQRYNQSQAWSPEGSWGSLQARTATEASVAERVGFIRKVYALFFVATLFAIGGVALGFIFPPLMMAVASSPWISLWVLLGGVMGAQAVRLVPVVNLLALFGFSTSTGVIISPLMFIVGRDNPASLVKAGVSTV